MQQKSSRTITRNDLMVCLPRSRSLAHTAHTHTSAEQALLLSSRHNRRCLEADRGLLSFSFSSILFSLSPSLSLSLSLSSSRGRDILNRAASSSRQRRLAFSALSHRHDARKDGRCGVPAPAPSSRLLYLTRAITTLSRR